jgi:hypothetical protein
MEASPKGRSFVLLNTDTLARLPGKLEEESWRRKAGGRKPRMVLKSKCCSLPDVYMESARHEALLC